MQEETKGGVADAFIFDDAGTGSERTYLKGADFDGKGLVLEVVGMEKSTPQDPKFGVSHSYGAGGKIVKENWFVKNGILKEGETFTYRFKQDGAYRNFDNGSVGFYFAFTRANPKPEEVVLIARNKVTDTNVEWKIEKK
jgi:hypothetical protein